MRKLPFAGAAFDKAVSVTAIEFIEEAKVAVEEMAQLPPVESIVEPAVHLKRPMIWMMLKGSRGREGKKG